MENASKALLIAGGVLISLIVVSGFILAMRYMGDFQTANQNAKLEQQTLEFNSAFESYNRNNIRGNDIVSLMNRVSDYNTRKVKEGYTEMQVTFYIPDDIREKLCFEEPNVLITTDTYTQDNIDDIVGIPDPNNAEYSVRGIENKYGQKYAAQLASEISTIKDLRDDYQASRKTTSEIDEEFATNYRFPKKVSEYDGGIEQMYKDAKLYYEYVQFKRAYFDCTSIDGISEKIEYDDDTNRIIKMQFKCTGIGV